MAIQEIDMVESASERRLAWTDIELGCNGTGEPDCKATFADLTAKTVVSDQGTALAVYAQHQHQVEGTATTDTVLSFALDPDSAETVFEVAELIAAVRAQAVMFDDDAAMVATVIAAYEHLVAENGERVRVFYEKKSA